LYSHLRVPYEVQSEILWSWVVTCLASFVACRCRFEVSRKGAVEKEGSHILFFCYILCVLASVAATTRWLVLLPLHSCTDVLEAERQATSETACVTTDCPQLLDEIRLLGDTLFV